MIGTGTRQNVNLQFLTLQHPKLLKKVVELVIESDQLQCLTSRTKMGLIKRVMLYFY